MSSAPSAPTPAARGLPPILTDGRRLLALRLMIPDATENDAIRPKRTPQIAQRVMRHSDHCTTLKHYTVLQLTETASAIDRVLGNQCEPMGSVAMGTDGRCGHGRVNPRGHFPDRRKRALRATSYCASSWGTKWWKTAPTWRYEAARESTSAKHEKAPHTQGSLQHSAGTLRKRTRGFEPPTYSLEGCHSTTELRPHTITESYATSHRLATFERPGGGQSPYPSFTARKAKNMGISLRIRFSSAARGPGSLWRALAHSSRAVIAKPASVSD